MPASQPQHETVTGQMAGPGVSCPQFRLDTGETISLEGPGLRDPLLQDQAPGARVQLTGWFLRASRCMQGRAFSVAAAAAAP